LILFSITVSKATHDKDTKTLLISVRPNSAEPRQRLEVFVWEPLM